MSSPEDWPQAAQPTDESEDPKSSEEIVSPEEVTPPEEEQGPVFRGYDVQELPDEEFLLLTSKLARALRSLSQEEQEAIDPKVQRINMVNVYAHMVADTKKRLGQKEAKLQEFNANDRSPKKIVEGELKQEIDDLNRELTSQSRNFSDVREQYDWDALDRFLTEHHLLDEGIDLSVD